MINGVPLKIKKEIRKNLIIYLMAIACFICVIPVRSFATNSNGWIYQNPYPTSNTLLGVKFVTPQKGWIVGEHGTILYTQNGGDTWVAQESGTEQDLRCVAFINEQQGWVVGNRGVIIHTSDGGVTWNVQGNYTQNLFKVFFVNEKDGWAGGYGGVLLHTTDGGIRWSESSLASGSSLNGIHFINSNVGWVMTGGRVFRTIDGGVNWEGGTKFKVTMQRTEKAGRGMSLSEQENDLPPDWWQGDIYFVNDKKGWAVVGLWYIFSTEDGGKTWTAIDFGYMSYGLGSITFSDEKTGCAGGSSIVCTEDGGKTWNERLGIKPGKREIRDDFWISVQNFSFVNKFVGWAAGNDGQTLITTDSGKSWKTQSRGGSFYVGSMVFLNDKIGWAVKSNEPTHKSEIVRTKDGAKTWSSQKEFETPINLRFFFVDSKNGWAVGWLWDQLSNYTVSGSIILHTDDGGATWVTQFQEKSHKLTLQDVVFTSSKEGWVVGSGGTILHTTDGGAHWIKQKSGTTYRLEGIRFIDSKIGWAIGYKGGVHEFFDDPKERNDSIIVHTEDGGHLWEEQLRKKYGFFKGMFFLDKNVGWVIEKSDDSRYSIYHTTNGGKTWPENELSDLDIDSSCFIDNDRGALFDKRGFMLITNDGSNTWIKQKTPLKKYPWNCSEIFAKPR